MLKVFLVEDEIVVREGIKNTISWEEEGFSFVGEAGDGELAYPLILKYRPDILITDIRMPFMDGLELSRLVKQDLPEIKILIISGYDEFDYAKQAISIGVTDYLVKPINGAQLLKSVKKIGKIIEEEQEQKQFLETFEQEREESRQLARMKLFRKIVSSKKSVSELLAESRQLGMDLTAKQYNILLFQIFDEGQAERYSEVQNRAAEAVERLAAARPQVEIVELGLEGWAFILKETGEETLSEITEDFLAELIGTVDSTGSIEFFGGLGRPTQRLSELGRCYSEASRAFAYRYLTERNQVIRIDMLQEENQEPNMEQLHAGKIDRKSILDFLATGLKSEVDDFVNDYIAAVGPEQIRSLMLRQYLVMDIWFMAADFLSSLGEKPEILTEKCGDFQKMPQVFAGTDAAADYIKDILRTTIEVRDGKSMQKYSSLLKEAKAFIRENYNHEDMSLNMVAAAVNLSPNHFSTIFSQEVGQTFIEYLTSVRMEKAKYLLRTSSMKTSEIAYAVGYKDAHYFSYLFKKTQNLTPRDYKAQALEE